MKRVPLRRRGRLRPVSAKRAAENRERRAVIAGLHPEQEPPLCTVREARAAAGLLPLPGCMTWAGDANEILRRSQGGSITDPANINFPCRPCHDVLTFTPRSQLGWALDLGLIIDSRWPAHG